jgi:predicted TIM-barrel fold metal-dependent hydrolase
MTTDPNPEPILEPDLPIVDAHHHLWYTPEAAIDAMATSEVLIVRELAAMYRKYARYLFADFMADLTSGHNVIATVYCDAHSMYRASGPPELASVGEVEFVNGVAAMGLSGLWGDIRVCAGIVGGGVDLRATETLEDVLAAHIRAGGDRYRGIRPGTMHDDDPAILGGGGDAHVLLDPQFRKGAEVLQRLGLSLDLMVLEPQLPDVVDFARALPELQIVLNHCGAPIGVGPYDREERFPTWYASIRELAACENVVVKVGGLGIPFPGFASYGAEPHAGSEQLAAEWRPYVEGCIEAFGADRCMLESNVPPDAATAPYPVLWNAFKRITAGASQAEKTALYSGTAIRVYSLDLE